MTEKNPITKEVKHYYGEVLNSKKDLKTTACCTADSMPKYLRPFLKRIHPDIQDKFYGCGSPIPYAIKDKTILDLGCGTGRDVYIASQLVGEKGRVIGIDMTESQLEVGKQYVDYHMKAFGYKKPNVTFHQAYIEDLSKLVKDNSVDCVISNCVINLSPNKEQVFREIFRVLKPGGELLFSDVFSDRRIPRDVQQDSILLGECLGNALYIEDFRRLLLKLNCNDFRVVTKSEITLTDPSLYKKAGMIGFYSMTIRTFKSQFEDICENYGHIAWYKGSIPDQPHHFILDDHHLFETNNPITVCGNTAKMLSETHYGPHFRIEGNFDNHFGVFDCSAKFSNANLNNNSNLNNSPTSNISNPVGGCC